MARREPRPPAERHESLSCTTTQCRSCGTFTHAAYHNRRRLMLLSGSVQYILKIRQCRTPTCALFRKPLRPEAEGALALPHSEYGLDVVALIGMLRFAQHRSVPEIHQELQGRGLEISERTVSHLMHRYEELLALRLMDATRLRARLRDQEQVILAVDGLQPDVGHEVLWVIRDVLSGEILLARALLGSGAPELLGLFRDVTEALGEGLPVTGVISDGQHSIRHAVSQAFPGVSHQLCQFHYLREAARPIFEADRHAKVQLKGRLRGIRKLERALDARTDPQAQVLRGYTLAVRSALTDDGRPPLAASGLQLWARMAQIRASLDRLVQVEKGGCPTES